MKKLAAITLLTVHLFNLAGYLLFFQYFIHQSDQRFGQQLDSAQYDVSDLLELKIPLHLPYIDNWSGYERVDGEVEFKGVHYNYVKRRVCNDTLYLMCLANKDKSGLLIARNDFTQKMNDIPSNNDGKPVLKKMGVFAQCDLQISAFGIESTAGLSQQQAVCFASPLSNSFIDKYFPPPKSA